MNRRLALAVLVALGLAPAAVRAQAAGKVWRVGFITQRRRPASIDADFIGAFPRAMRELGYVEGRNLSIEWRFEESAERLPDVAAELVRLGVDVLVSGSSQAIAAMQKATRTIPIVMASSGDPVGSGFVKSLARPEGNITGLSNLTGDIGTKQFELLRGVLPKLVRLAVLVNPANPAHAPLLRHLQAEAPRSGLSLLPLEVRTALDVDEAFPRMRRWQAGAVVVAADALFVQHFRRIADLAKEHRLPSVSQIREFVDAGGLMSYGPDLADHMRRAATYVDRIFKGARPSDLPVEQSTRFALFINAGTARALGIVIPQSMRLRADQVVE